MPLAAPTSIERRCTPTELALPRTGSPCDQRRHQTHSDPVDELAVVHLEIADIVVVVGCEIGKTHVEYPLFFVIDRV